MEREIAKAVDHQCDRALITNLSDITGINPLWLRTVNILLTDTRSQLLAIPTFVYHNIMFSVSHMWIIVHNLLHVRN